MIDIEKIRKEYADIELAIKSAEQQLAIAKHDIDAIKEELKLMNITEHDLDSKIDMLEKEINTLESEISIQLKELTNEK
jgi:predicted  nucleic acid-binding Zn-ribbon protein